MSLKRSPLWALMAGTVAAFGASVCCAGPLVLLMLGVSGSWISSLTAFDVVRPYFIVVVVAFFLWAGWQLYRPIASCPEGSVCAIPRYRRLYRILFWVLVGIAGVLVSSPWWLAWLV